jgi:hypothetical protein
VGIYTKWSYLDFIVGFTFLLSDREEMILWKIRMGHPHCRVVEEGKSIFYMCLELRSV